MYKLFYIFSFVRLFQFLQIVNTRWVCSLIHSMDDSILIGCEVPDINYFLTLIKHYFFSQFYNYKKNKSFQIKASIVNLNPDTVREIPKHKCSFCYHRSDNIMKMSSECNSSICICLWMILMLKHQYQDLKIRYISYSSTRREKSKVN
jgi:hypothetical protein